jgi:hypothetical protein
MNHPVVTIKPWCGDCGKTRATRYCGTCCYPVCPECTAAHQAEVA